MSIAFSYSPKTVIRISYTLRPQCLAVICSCVNPTLHSCSSSVSGVFNSCSDPEERLSRFVCRLEEILAMFRRVNTVDLTDELAHRLVWKEEEVMEVKESLSW